MLNLRKNVIKLLSTDPVVGIEPIWILSHIFIKSVKFIKLLMPLIYRVYQIPTMLLPSIEKQYCCCLSSKDMVEWIDEDANHTLNHTNGKTYSR